MKTRVVNLRTEPYDVYIGRAGRGKDGYFGNPFRGPNRADVIEQYRKHFHERIKSDATFRSRVAQLRGLRLGCFCKPRPCHGDVIVEYLEGTAPP